MYFDIASRWQDDERPSRIEVLSELEIEWGVGVIVVVGLRRLCMSCYGGLVVEITGRIQLCRWLRNDAVKCGRNAERYDDETRKDSRGRVSEADRREPVSGTSNTCTIRPTDRRSDPVLIHSGRECNAKRQN